MADYYNLIMGNDTSSFIPTFNKLWKNEILSQNLPYTHALQIETGTRLRPLLMAWGYYANCITLNNNYIADCALSIELLHKSTILLDDLIDDDIARHEKATFHVQYSKSEALLYAFFMLNRGITLMHQKDISNNSTYTSILLNTMNNMIRGGIKEVSSNDVIFNMTDVKEIIELETISIIQNSFILGYQLSSEKSSPIPNDIANIGYLCGYCFQVLNDIEPFSDPVVNKKYKGNVNYDFEKQRKNIVMSYLFSSCTQQEQENLKKGADFNYVCTLVNKYGILEQLFAEVENKISNIVNSIDHLQSKNIHYYNDFKKFLAEMFMICYKKCGLRFRQQLIYN